MKELSRRSSKCYASMMLLQKTKVKDHDDEQDLLKGPPNLPDSWLLGFTKKNKRCSPWRPPPHKLQDPKGSWVMFWFLKPQFIHFALTGLSPFTNCNIVLSYFGCYLLHHAAIKVIFSAIIYSASVLI